MKTQTQTPESDALRAKVNKFLPYIVFIHKVAIFSLTFFGGYLFCKIGG